MAISINWQTGIITIPKADLTLIQSNPTEIRELNLNTFRLTLKDLEDDEAGMPHVKTHNHNTTVTVGGVTLARVIEILDPYTITFEDGQYAVNLVGANSNVADKTNVNQVSIRSANSAGLIEVNTTGVSGASAQEIWEYADRTLTQSISGGGATAQEVWEYNTRTLTQQISGGGASAQEVWEYASRTLTQMVSGGATAQEVWEYANRTLTQMITGGASAQEVWEYVTRTLTAGTKDTEIDQIKSKTDNLPADPASNTQVNTRLASASYVAPDNTSITAIKQKTDNLPPQFKKNTAFNNFGFVMKSETNHITPLPGLSITAERSIDGGVFASCANASTEIGSGAYKIDFAASDLNGNIVIFKFTATGADPVLITIITNI